MSTMTKRQAMKLAHRIAYRFLQQALDGGGSEASDYGSEQDQIKVEAALDRLTQRHFELGAEEKGTTHKAALQ